MDLWINIKFKALFSSYINTEIVSKCEKHYKKSLKTLLEMIIVNRKLRNQNFTYSVQYNRNI